MIESILDDMVHERCRVCGEDLYAAIHRPQDALEVAIAGADGHICGACSLRLPPVVVSSWCDGLPLVIQHELRGEVRGVVEGIWGDYLCVGGVWLRARGIASAEVLA